VRNWQTALGLRWWSVTTHPAPLNGIPIEHRLFSFVSPNWAGQPLRSLSRMTALIWGTVTTMGLQVKSCCLEGELSPKIKVSNAEMVELALTRRKICPQWNPYNPRSSNSSKQWGYWFTATNLQISEKDGCKIRTRLSKIKALFFSSLLRMNIVWTDSHALRFR
jgi:hypothetical protein